MKTLNNGKELKIIIVGNAGSGKTSFVQRWTKNVFNESYKATIVSEFGYKLFSYEGKIYKIQMWDLAGQDKNTSMAKVFCKDSHGVIIMADVTEEESLVKSLNWKKSVDDSVCFFDGSNLPMMLLQNKIDLTENFKTENFEEFSKQNNFVSYFQTSVKENININESMNEFISIIIKKTQNIVYETKDEIDSIILRDNIQGFGDNKYKKNCC